MTHRPIGASIFALLLTVAFSAFAEQTGKSSNFKLAIVSIVEIDPIVQLRKGFKEVFDASDFAKSHTVTAQEYNAQGDTSLINQIADQVALDKPDLIFVLGTPMAQALQKRSAELLIVQGAVTDPVEAGLAASWDGSGKKYIATSDLPPIEQLVSLMRQLTPNAKTIGVIYNPGEANSVAVVKRLRRHLTDGKIAWRIVDGPLANSADVPIVMQSFLGKVDLVFMPPDNTAASAMGIIGKYTTDYKIPFYATNSTVLDHGALAVVSLDFIQLGRESAYLALEVLNGKDPKTVPIRVIENPSVIISRVIATKLKVDLSALKEQPDIIIR